MNPLVSICIPLYNNASTIEETVRSVISQTYRPLELIIVDDNSTDNSYDVVNSILAELPENLDVLRHLERNTSNLGMSGNWNRCLSLCNGRYIKLLCADDTIDSSLVEREVEVLEHFPEVLSVESDTAFVDRNGKITGHYNRYRKSGTVSGRETARYSLFHRDYLGAPLANLFRRTAYEQYGGFDPDFHYIVDYEFFMRLACAGDVFIIHEPLNFFRLRHDSNTSQVLGGDEGRCYVEEHRRLAEKFAAELSLSPSDIRRSVRIRRLMNLLGGIYLKLHIGGRQNV